ncbi:hypothetical protein [Ruegeria faecimaris]|uniref:hypothetical protein n=1 Tax=Ruegeria faecimaris TaxID=686389 RepID=UPI00248F9F72|nr:hypothetical protein [Ruegeria faecimaris]
MLAILARSFMVATKTEANGKGTGTDSRDLARSSWLPDHHWWIEKSGPREKAHLDCTNGGL